MLLPPALPAPLQGRHPGAQLLGVQVGYGVGGRVAAGLGRLAPPWALPLIHT
ncbi:hypothetical protein [Streptomyces specialis]|uniref:hypothetical protein n=1 Tax=Streptomyces specialis TaxID=498367 RepID=UPI00131C0B38|nr:hypothetical protein [Streptomyces specialis]